MPQHRVDLTPSLAKQADAYLNILQSDTFSPPTDQAVEPELLALLVQEGRVVKVSDEVVFSREAYQQMTDQVVKHIKEQGFITVAQARNLFNSSRKYVLPLLEHMDQQRITRRVGDERVLR